MMETREQKLQISVDGRPMSCPACARQNFRRPRPLPDVTDNPYFECMLCNTWMQPPLEQFVFESDENADTGHLMSEDDQRVNRSLAQAFVKSYSPKRVLDIGTRYPFLLKCFLEEGVPEVLGVDGCDRVLSYGEALGVPTKQGNFLDMALPGNYDLVTMVHVLEHFDQPRIAVGRVLGQLAVGGHFWVRTPNPSSVGITRHMGKAHYDVHPILLSPAGVQWLFQTPGWKLVEKWESDNGGEHDFVYQRIK